MDNIFEIFELIITENMSEGVQAVSWVTEGAIDRNFVHMKKEHEVKLEIQDEEKRLVVGPILVPNKMILRAYEEEGKDTQYYYIHFSEDTVRKTAHRFMALGNQDNTTYQHAIDVDGATFVETWVKDFEDDKSTGYGYGDMTIGTWFGMAKITNDQLWEDIKAGKVNAFSIEGRFADKALAQSKLPTEEEDTQEELELINKILKMIDSVDENVTE